MLVCDLPLSKLLCKPIESGECKLSLEFFAKSFLTFSKCSKYSVVTYPVTYSPLNTEQSNVLISGLNFLHDDNKSSNSLI